MIRVTVENIKQLFLKTGQFQEIPDDTFTLLKPVEKIQHDNTVNLYCNHIISKQSIVQEVEICLNKDKTGVIIYFTCYCMDPYEPVTHSVILPCSCEDVSVAVFDDDGILCGESELLHEQLNKKNIGPPEWIGSPEWSLDDGLEKLKHEIEQKNNNEKLLDEFNSMRTLLNIIQKQINRKIPSAFTHTELIDQRSQAIHELKKLSKELDKRGIKHEKF